jgi:hypothetical protein
VGFEAVQTRWYISDNIQKIILATTYFRFLIWSDTPLKRTEASVSVQTDVQTVERAATRTSHSPYVKWWLKNKD